MDGRFEAVWSSIRSKCSNFQKFAGLKSNCGSAWAGGGQPVGLIILSRDNLAR